MTFFNLPIAKEITPREIPVDANDRHLSMLRAIAPYSKQQVQKNVTDVAIHKATRTTKMALVLLPEWAPFFPPFNLARLSAVAREAGYDTRILDLNAKCYNEWNKNIRKTVDFGLWDGASSWKWHGENYYKHLHPYFEPILRTHIKEIVEYNPTIVGVTIYYCSEEPSKWFIQELKKELPNVKIAVGGSNVQNGWFQHQPYYDYVVSGEGEQAILSILDELENGVTHNRVQFIKQPEEQRINISNLPMPDYSSINFNEYAIPNGVNSELSRGCTAKCTFCEETHFWKYRQRQAVDILSEIEWLYYNKGTDVVWFIDSLVNGNLKELRAFAKGVVAKGMKIHWTGYARCDGRMDFEYMKDLADSGCVSLNYGCESGSQKVLDDMNKGVTVEEMEQNFRDGSKLGIKAATNWIVGFPTEEPVDFAKTMAFLWRMKDYNLSNVGTGTGFSQGPETITGQNPDKFNLSAHKYLNYWITKDFSRGGSHILTRVKCFTIFVDQIAKSLNDQLDYTRRPNLAKRHYSINFYSDKLAKNIEYENFDYDIIKVDINPYANSLVNEIWPLLRMLWLTKGGFETTILFSPELDSAEFGDHFGSGQYTATYKFNISDDGVWNADFDIKFKQVYVPHAHDNRPVETQGPFMAQEFSRLQSNPAIRARKLAKPIWIASTGRTDAEFGALMAEERELNKTIDWSFEHAWKGNGKW